MPEIIFQNTLLDGNLRYEVEVLHAAATANTKDLAFGARAINRRFNQSVKLCFCKACLIARQGIGHLFGGECATDEHHLTGLTVLIEQASDALRIEV